MLADYLRTDGHRLARLRPLDAATRSLHALVRTRADHVAAETLASNQLHAILEAHWPAANAIFSRLGSTIALDFLDDYPSSESAARLGEARLAMFCRQHSYLRSSSPRAPRPPAVGSGRPHRTRPRNGRRPRPRPGATAALDTIGRLDRAIGAVLVDHPKAPLLAHLPASARSAALRV